MKNIFLSVVLFFVTVYSNAQLKEAIMNKVGENIKNKKQTTSSSDSNSSNKQPANTTGTENSSYGDFSSGSKKDIEAEYKFNHNALIELQNYKKSGEKDGEAMLIRYFFSKEKNYFGSEIMFEDKKGNKTANRSIYEFDKNKMITLTENGDSKIAMVIKFNLADEANKYADSSKFKIVKTGKTKTILNYHCEEYISTDDDGNKTEMWVSQQIPFNMAKIAAANKAGKNNAPANIPATGFTLEMTIYDKKGVKKTTWVAKEINLNQNTTFTTEGYKFFGF